MKLKNFMSGNRKSELWLTNVIVSILLNLLHFWKISPKHFLPIVNDTNISQNFFPEFIFLIDRKLAEISVWSLVSITWVLLLFYFALF